jgi:predicted transcriptional regulator
MKRKRLVAGRRIGAVEAEVLECLWEAGRPQSVHDVMQALSGERRAYTTVVTMLTRLVEKGFVRRMPDGRSFLYEASGTEDELAGDAIRDVLEATRDRKVVLARFVDQISDDPELLQHLREIVKRGAKR